MEYVSCSLCIRYFTTLLCPSDTANQMGAQLSFVSLVGEAPEEQSNFTTSKWPAYIIRQQNNHIRYIITHIQRIVYNSPITRSIVNVKRMLSKIPLPHNVMVSNHPYRQHWFQLPDPIKSRPFDNDHGRQLYADPFFHCSQCSVAMQQIYWEASQLLVYALQNTPNARHCIPEYHILCLITCNSMSSMLLTYIFRGASVHFNTSNIQKQPYNIFVSTVWSQV